MRKIMSILFIFLFECGIAYSQGFTQINAGLTGLHWSDVAWGDYDGDSDLDVIISGLDSNDNPVTKLYKNEGADTFTQVAGVSITGVYIGDMAWGDYDADGDLDVLLLGYDASGFETTILYENAGDDRFIDSGINFPQVADGSTSFVDYNNDGYLDILLVGFDGNEYITGLYKNNGDATFSLSNINLPSSIKCAYEWADYDNDGDLDVFLTGFDSSGNLLSTLYENNEGHTFTETANTFTGAWLGDAAWGDYDNDGYLDILLSGFAMPNDRIAKLYKNNGDGTFTENTSAGLTGVSHSSTIWGDYDNDGDLDVFIGGTFEAVGSWTRVTDVFINNADNTFTAAGLNFTIDSYWGESAWGDYDADGDMDLICCGFDDVGGSNTIIYRNDASTPNTIPNAPQNLDVSIIENSVLLSWDAGSDNETPSAGLTYNGYIRTEEGEIVWNALSTTPDGQRLIPALGNAQQNTNWLIKDLADGNYFWSVQTLDNNFAGSLFGDEESFTIGTIGVENRDEWENFEKLSNYPNPFHINTTIEFYLKESAGHVEIEIYNVTGQLVRSLGDQKKTSGRHALVWDGTNNWGQPVGSGQYYYALSVDHQLHSVNTCLLLK